MLLILLIILSHSMFPVYLKSIDLTNNNYVIAIDSLINEHDCLVFPLINPRANIRIDVIINPLKFLSSSDIWRTHIAFNTFFGNF